MQGPSELGLSGTLEDWDRSGDLRNIDVPTLVIGATHDTMDPAHMRWMSEQLPKGRYLHCPDGSHLAQFGDPDHYFPGLIEFVRSLSPERRQEEGKPSPVGEGSPPQRTRPGPDTATRALL